jgi:hypothetical protein
MYFHPIHKSRKLKIEKLSQLQTNPDRYVHSLGTKPARDLTWERGMRCVRIAASRVWRITRDSSIARLQQRSREEKCGTPRERERERERDRSAYFRYIYIYIYIFKMFILPSIVGIYSFDQEIENSHEVGDNKTTLYLSLFPRLLLSPVLKAAMLYSHRT